MIKKLYKESHADAVCQDPTPVHVQTLAAFATRPAGCSSSQQPASFSRYSVSFSQQPASFSQVSDQRTGPLLVKAELFQKGPRVSLVPNQQKRISFTSVFTLNKP